MSISHKASNLALHNRVCSIPEGGILFPFDDGLHGIDSAGNIIYPEEDVVATLRPNEGRFGGAVAVEEGTTNLCLYPSFETNTSGWTNQFGSGGFGRDTSQSYHGIASAKCIRMNSIEMGRAYFTVPLKAGECLTLSGYALAFESESVYVSIEYQGGDYFWKIFDSGKHSGSGQWERLTVTGEFATSDCTAYCFIYNKSQTTAAYWDAIQIEKLPFATSFVDGTRAASMLTYDASIMPVQSATVAAWVWVPPSSHWSSSNWRRIISNANSSAARMIALYLLPTDRKLYLQLGDDSNMQQTISSPSSIAEGWHHVVATWDASRMALYADGSLVAQRTNPSLPTSHPYSWIAVGSRTDDMDHLNGLIDELLILPYAATDEEIKAWYHSNASMHNNADAYVTL